MRMTSTKSKTPSPEVQGLLELVDHCVRENASTLGFSRLSPEVRAALARVPRDQFIEGPSQAQAYENVALPIGLDQTISQPFVVAAMTQALAPRPGQRVLEIGTGSGYQAAILAELGLEVFSIERHPELSRLAAVRLAPYGDRVRLAVGDGARGWPEEAPFDGIIVTAAAARIPKTLVDQLANRGRLVIPVGPEASVQSLALVERVGRELTVRELLAVSFVPLIESAS
jgi:protein-L-isoaspartate(D-aspartate) O-methyltransferase